MSEDSNTVITMKVRVSPKFREKIAETAKANNRSMNAEIVSRLEQSFAERPHSVDEVMIQIESGMKTIFSKLIDQGVSKDKIVKAIDDSGLAEDKK